MVSNFRWHEKVPLINLSDISNVAFSVVKFVGKRNLLTGGHDREVGPD